MKECKKCINSYIDDNGERRCVFNEEKVEDKEAPRVCVDRGDYVAVDTKTPSLF